MKLKCIQTLKIIFIKCLRKLIQILISSHSYQESYINKKEELESNTPLFYPLSPAYEIPNGEPYFSALRWALTNRKEKGIKNIALTGPYGSGKSSILQSFQKEYKKNDLHFINISLASFKEEKKTTDGENLQRLIELSILQQLFYRERESHLPDSRLRKITKFSKKRLFFSALFNVILLMAFIFLIIFLYKPDTISLVFPKISISETVKLVIHYFSLVLSFIGIFIISIKSVRILHNLRINKFNIKNAEIVINDNINKSVLNQNLDEILYFFEVTNYNVVIIEDLDRFESTEIFAKLREINLLINNSKFINKDVVFIYAVRDDMFIDKDRTKFFDFIIPVIPVINLSNSNEILKMSIEAITNKVSESLIKDISLFIDEMRVLYNIVNEFKIYKQILSNNLQLDKLLAMIVYKNICPYDFMKLGVYEGDLYSTINKKYEYIRSQSELMDKNIAKYKEEIKKLDALKIKNMKELRSLYVLQYIKELNGISAFYINNQTYNYEQVISDDLFSYFTSDNIYYNFFNPNNYSRLQNGTKIELKFANIEKQVDSEYTYKQREQEITDWNNGKIQELRLKIASIEQQKNELKHEKISKFLSNKSISIEVRDNREKLVNLLLRNGYIDENYMDYISLFHEGSLSKNDHIFLLNVKSQISTDFNHNLDNIDNLIKEININDFKNNYILNFRLVGFILTNNKYEQQREAIFSVLKNETMESLKFIDDYIDNGTRIDLFLKELYRHQINIFDIMYQDSRISLERKEHYLNLVIENVNITDIISTKESNLPKLIANNPQNNYNVFYLVSDETRIRDLLKAFDIKFNYDINPHDMSESMLDYIYQNNHYTIRTNLLKIIIQAKGNFNQVDFDTRNYYAIKNSNLDILIKYIDDNIKNYITNVYLKIETNMREDEECLILLLNNEKLDKKDKIAIIQKIKTKISNLEKIEDLEIENALIQSSKIGATWGNIIDNYCKNEQELKEHILVFLNDIENAKELSRAKIEKDKPDQETVNKFLLAMILNKSINIASYSLLLHSVPYYYPSLDFEDLPMENIRSLIEKNILGLNKENFNKLKEEGSDLHIKLTETRKQELPKKLPELLLDDNDVISLLKSTILSSKEKRLIISSCNNESIVKNIEILELIGEMILNENIYDFDKKIIKAILEKTKKSTEKKIKIFIKTNDRFDENDITNILSSFFGPYSNLLDDIVIPKNSINIDFLKELIEKKYIKDFKYIYNGIKIIMFEKNT